jgi:hypothetical protein
VRKRAHPATYPRFGRAARSHSHAQHHARRGQLGSALLPNTAPPPPGATPTPSSRSPMSPDPAGAHPRHLVQFGGVYDMARRGALMATIWPGSTARAAARSRGHRRCQQPLQCPPGSPVHAATRADREPARSPRWPIGLTMSRLQVPAANSHGPVLALTELVGAPGRDLDSATRSSPS